MHGLTRVLPSECSESLVTQKFSSPRPTLKTTPLHSLHKALGARMSAFAGFDMPINYGAGIIAEHKHCRQEAALFDTSHMIQFRLHGAGTLLETADALEMLVPANIRELPSGRLCYTMFTNERGGIIDDLILARDGNHFRLIGNASRREVDEKIISGGLPSIISYEILDHALLALQGPKAEMVLRRHSLKLDNFSFMWGTKTEIAGLNCWVSRSGYTGEDGFEISVQSDNAVALAETLLAEDEVKLAGLGARDSLRLEAGLCLYGTDLDETTTPIEAGLDWTIPKRRRHSNNFPGAETIMQEFSKGPARRRVGILPTENTIARKGTLITAENGDNLGIVTSGGFGPTVGGPIAVGYVKTHAAKSGYQLNLRIRDRETRAVVTPLPFVERNYRKK